MKTAATAVLAATLIGAFASFAGTPCIREVRFAKGASSATYSGRIAGYEYCDYVFAANAGQVLTVKVTGRHTNRITPVLFDPEVQQDIWRPLELSRGGKHTVRIIMPRVFARLGDAVSYKVTITIH